MIKKILQVLLLSSATYASEGTVIILNGPSCVGKSSIQKVFQKQATQTYLRVGIDNFFDALIEEPDLSEFETTKKFDQYSSQGEYIRGIESTTDRTGHKVVTLKIGPAGDRIISGMHKAIAAYAKAGNNVIVDYIQYKNIWAQDLKTSLKECKVIYVKVNAPLDVIEERELARSTSPAGHARSHYDTVHEGMVYDIEVDTSKESPEDCAQKILK
jgi:chloramphenicol 3-O phosphotransferase